MRYIYAPIMGEKSREVYAVYAQNDDDAIERIREKMLKANDFGTQGMWGLLGYPMVKWEVPEMPSDEHLEPAKQSEAP